MQETMRKPRSCAVCRSRKVRCDKQSPCSNCRQAGIACVLPAKGRPRWARRLERNAGNSASSTKTPQDVGHGEFGVMEKLHNLENLVKELRSQLEQTNTPSSFGPSDALRSNSPYSSITDRESDYHINAPSPITTDESPRHFGRLVFRDSNQSRYISSGFWSWVEDELHGLKMETNSPESDDSESLNERFNSGQPSSTREMERTPSDRHAFLFQHNLNRHVHSITNFHPLPSQIPFLLNVYSENVNIIIQVVHMPTVTKTIRNKAGGNVPSLSLVDEALMFAIYYAAVTSMEEDDVMTNFGVTKVDLNLKFRLGLEYALAKADFLNVPDIGLVQAFAIFLFLTRRHDSPRFVWMMTGLLLRMAQALGLQKDGTEFDNLTSYEIEMRRRVWWAICLLDLRSSEDQGSEMGITIGSFNTKLPSNIDDADLNTGTNKISEQHSGLTDMSIALSSYHLVEVMRQMMAHAAQDRAPNLENQTHLLNEMYERVNRCYLQYSTETGNLVHWIIATCTRLTIAKMTLIVYLPFLFSSPSGDFSDEIRTKLLVSAIEVAEYNHIVNAEESCRQWRWVYQTYTHWHAIIYLLLESSRRSWSPTIERAWLALHSIWLIPAQSKMDRNAQFWIPLRKLIAKAKKNRTAELRRLQNDANAAEQLEIEDSKIPLPTSSIISADESSGDLFREHWRQLVSMAKPTNENDQLMGVSGTEFLNASIASKTADAKLKSNHNIRTTQEASNLTSPGIEPSIVSNGPQSLGQDGSIISTSPDLDDIGNAKNTLDPSIGMPSTDLLDKEGVGSNHVPWLWPDMDVSVNTFDDLHMDVDLEDEINWFDWLKSAENMERNSTAGLS